jgi:hypothetical protein
LRGGDKEDHSSRPDEKNPGDPITTNKKLGAVADTCHPIYMGKA